MYCLDCIEVFSFHAQDVKIICHERILYCIVLNALFVEMIIVLGLCFVDLMYHIY